MEIKYHHDFKNFPLPYSLSWTNPHTRSEREENQSPRPSCYTFPARPNPTLSSAAARISKQRITGRNSNGLSVLNLVGEFTQPESGANILNMKNKSDHAVVSSIRAVVSTQLPTKLGAFETVGFERVNSNGTL